MKYRHLQDVITNQEVWLRKVGTKNKDADGLTKTVNQHVLRNMLTTLKIELFETSKEQLSINLIDCKNKLMGAEDLDAGSPGRQSKCWTQEHCEGLPRKQEHREGLPRNKNIVKDCRENKSIVKDCRENWHKNIVKDCRENWHMKIVTDGRENWHKKIVTDGRENWHKKIVTDCREHLQNSTQEHCDGLLGKLEGYRVNLKRERAELREGLPGKIEKVVTHEQKQVVNDREGFAQSGRCFVEASVSCRNTSISHASVKHGKASPSCHAQDAQTLLHR